MDLKKGRIVAGCYKKGSSFKRRMKLHGTGDRILCALFFICLIMSGILFEQYALAGSVQASEESTRADVPWFELSGGLQYGSIDGFLQTPSGGHQGTTSHKRPTFDELGINTVLSFDGSLDVHWKMHTLTAGIQLNRFSDNSTLHNQLISQSISFPANSEVASDIRLDWYRFGYLYTFDLSPKDHRKTVFISPGVDIALLDFHYELKGVEDEHVNRSYTKGSLRLLCNIDWKISDGLDLQAGASGSLPISNTPSIINLSLAAEKNLFSTSGIIGSAYLGIAYEKIEYEDNQDVPNHIKAEMWPLVTTGLKMKF
jgi:hypothetical protein